MSADGQMSGEGESGVKRWVLMRSGWMLRLPVALLLTVCGKSLSDEMQLALVQCRQAGEELLLGSECTSDKRACALGCHDHGHFC